MVANCLRIHFGRWLDQLSPRVVVFIGKWAADQAGHEVMRRGIPFAYMNRQRSLSSEERLLNRRHVVVLVRGPEEAVQAEGDRANKVEQHLKTKRGVRIGQADRKPPRRVERS
jgi:hypothetical protein